MPTYRVFGNALGSDLDFPELVPIEDQAPRWQVRHSQGPPPKRLTLLREAFAPPCTIRLHRADEGFWYEHLCTGSYLVSPDGSLVEYHPLPGADLSAVRFDLLGRVMALALHAGGHLSLHGSAIQLGPDGGVLGFIAPKGIGKSTLASALVRAGALLVSDDLLVIHPGTPSQALPGIPRLRLRDDSFGSIQPRIGRSERGPDGKQVITELPDSRIMHQPGPLSAVYWLHPALATDQVAATRERLPEMDGARALIAQGKNAVVMGPKEMMDLIERAISVARSLPVFRLRISRDLGRMGEVIERFHEWHNAEPLVRAGN